MNYLKSISYLGILILSFMILSVTLLVRLKIESLSGLTDLVVSMTNTRGGFNTLLESLPWPSPWPPDCGQFWHLQPTHLTLLYRVFNKILLNKIVNKIYPRLWFDVLDTMLCYDGTNVNIMSIIGIEYQVRKVIIYV